MSSALIIAGEASGDRHASRLVGLIRRERPDLEFWGIGGELLREQGVETLVDAADMNVIGFIEVVKRYRYFRGVFDSILSEAVRRKPSFAILVDYPGFNLRLAAALHERGIPVIFYIAPQVWAWKEGRVKQLRRYVDDLIVVFPFELDYFKARGITPYFFGHPLVEEIGKMKDEIGVRENLTHPSSSLASLGTGFIPHTSSLAYLPGSRNEEIARHMPIICDVMNMLGDRYRHLIPRATTVSHDLLQKFSSRARFEIVDSSFEALSTARAALVKSGTSTLDATLLGVPFAVLYKTSAISYHIAKRLISVPYIAMTNVLAGRPVVREFVQDDVKPEALAAEMERLIAEGEYRRSVCEGLREVREMLGPPGASERIARFIIEKYLT